MGSVAGGWLPLLVRYTHLQMQVVLSFVGALMLGVALFHLLPHGIVAAGGDVDLVVFWTMVGLLVMFFLIRAFHFHQHDTEDQALHAEHVPHHDHKQAHHHEHGHGNHQPPVHRYGWLGVALGLSLHTLIDGVALGSATLADAGHTLVPGFAIFLAILLHKPLDALSITTLMTASGWDTRTCQLVNVCFAMMCPLGALLVILGLGQAGSGGHTVLGCALGFSAGVFLCISLGDLLPEVQFHRHDRVKLSVALLLGVAVAFGIRFLEPAGVHPPGGAGDEQQQEEPGVADHEVGQRR